MTHDSGAPADPEAMVSSFEQGPAALLAFDGPDLVVAAVNEAARQLAGRGVLVGRRAREIFPEPAARPLVAVLERVYRSAETIRDGTWRFRRDTPGRRIVDVDVKLVVAPWRNDDGSVRGVLVHGLEVAGLMPARRAAAEEAAAVNGDRAAVVALQDALLPPGLPVLPGVQLAASYLPGGAGPTACGDWFDALPRPDGTVALVVGDVVGRGASACAAMARLRGVLADRLGSGEPLDAAMAAVDRYAGSAAGAVATTVCAAVLDPRRGLLTYCTAGHPPPLVVDSDGVSGFLPASGAGPLGMGTTFEPAEIELALHDMVLLYSDGILNRPGRTPMQSSAELARTVAETLANRAQPVGAPPEAMERVCAQTSALLTEDSGYVDDVTLLAAQRVPEAGPLHVELPAEVATVRRVRPDLAIWLLASGAGADDVVAIQHAVGEIVTNAVEHAPLRANPCCVVLHGVLDPGGVVHIEVTDDGRWRDPDLSVPFRGNGLAMAGLLSDDLRVRPGPGGTSVTVRRRLVRAVAPYSWRFEQVPERARRAGLDITLLAPSLLGVRGAVDLQGATALRDDLLRHTRAGTVAMTVDLSEVTLLSSAAVQVLHEALARATAQRTPLRLRAPAGSVGQHEGGRVARGQQAAGERPSGPTSHERCVVGAELSRPAYDMPLIGVSIGGRRSPQRDADGGDDDLDDEFQPVDATGLYRDADRARDGRADERGDDADDDGEPDGNGLASRDDEPTQCTDDRADDDRRDDAGDRHFSSCEPGPFSAPR